MSLKIQFLDQLNRRKFNKETAALCTAYCGVNICVNTNRTEGTHKMTDATTQFGFNKQSKQ